MPVEPDTQHKGVLWAFRVIILIVLIVTTANIKLIKDVRDSSTDQDELSAAVLQVTLAGCASGNELRSDIRDTFVGIIRGSAGQLKGYRDRGLLTKQEYERAVQLNESAQGKISGRFKDVPCGQRVKPLRK